MSIVVVAAALLFSQTSAPAAPANEPATTPPAQTAPASDPGDRMVCRSESVVGTNRRRRVCMTARQREEIRQRGQTFRDNLDRPYNPDSAPTGGG